MVFLNEAMISFIQLYSLEPVDKKGTAVPSRLVSPLVRAPYSFFGVLEFEPPVVTKLRCNYTIESLWGEIFYTGDPDIINIA